MKLLRFSIRIAVLWMLIGALCPAGRAEAATASKVELTFDALPLKQNSDGYYEVLPDSGIDLVLTSTEDLSGKLLQIEDNEGVLTAISGNQYAATIKIPSKIGDEKIVWKEDRSELVKLRILETSVVIDPTGQPAYGGRVTLYTRDFRGLWQIWIGPADKQSNPKQLGYAGRYAFYVEPGEYYVLIESSGSEPFKSEPRVVTEVTVLSEGTTLSYAQQLPDIQHDATVVTLVSMIVDRINELRENLEFLNLTKKAILPFTWTVFLLTFLGFLLSFVFQFGFALSRIPNVQMVLVQSMMQILGRKQSTAHWGRVTDQQSGFPLPMAAVMLFHEDDHKLINMFISDMSGGYGFTPHEGRYSLFVSRKGYVFPPEMKQDCYLGKPFVVSETNPPMVNLELSHLTKSESDAAVLKILKHLGGAVTNLILIAGFLSSIWSAVMVPGLMTISLVLFYIWLIASKLKKTRRDKQIKQIETGA
jgi:hypothetical protein